MFESTTYNATIDKGVAIGVQRGIEEGERLGRLRGERELVLRFGEGRLGKPGKKIVALLEAVTDTERFPELLNRVSAASSWDEVFAPG